MAAWKYGISLLVLEKHFTRSLRSLVKYFSTIEGKFRISARPYPLFLVPNMVLSKMNVITSIGQSKHMRVTRFNPLWDSGAI